MKKYTFYLAIVLTGSLVITTQIWADTPLNEACKAGQIARVQELLDAGENPNKPGEKGCTALHWACNHSIPKIVTLLIARGGNLATPNLAGLTPLDMARKKSFPTILAVVERAAAVGGGAAAPIHKPKKTLKAAGHQAGGGLATGKGSKAAVARAPKLQLQMMYPVVRRPLNAAAIAEIEGKIGYTFNDKKKLIQALTSRSVDPANNYEAYEMLGDKILDAILVRMMMETFPGINEGQLTTMRTTLVKQEPMAALCLYLGLHSYVQDIETVIHISTLCDLIESVIASIDLDGGSQPVKDFIVRFFAPMFSLDCLKDSLFLIEGWAKQEKMDVEYRWNSEGMCTLVPFQGTGKIIAPSISTKKQSAPRLSRYLAEKAFIERKLPASHKKYLVRLAIDPDYKPYDAFPTSARKFMHADCQTFAECEDSVQVETDVACLSPFPDSAFAKESADADCQTDMIEFVTDDDGAVLFRVPVLSLDWHHKVQANSRVRLHTLMQKLGRGTPAYSDIEDATGEDSPFLCTLMFDGKSVTGRGKRKTLAQENAAEEAYRKIQTELIFSPEFQCSAHDVECLAVDRPVAQLNEFCQKHTLPLPDYASFYEDQEGELALYSTMRAPWLLDGEQLRGDSELTLRPEGAGESATQAAKASVARKCINLIKTLSTQHHDPKLMHVLNRIKDTQLQSRSANPNRMGLLIELCQTLELEKPIIHTKFCQGPVCAFGPEIESSITINFGSACPKTIIRQRAHLRLEAEDNAAKEALNFMLNKIVDDILLADLK